jgi:hypothetical protein
MHLAADAQECKMPSPTEFCLFIAAFVAAYAFGDDVLRHLRVRSSQPRGKRKRLLLTLASIAALAFAAAAMALVGAGGGSHAITSTGSPSATDHNLGNVTLHIQTTGIRV